MGLHGTGVRSNSNVRISTGVAFRF